MRLMPFNLALFTLILLALGACSSSPKTAYYKLNSPPIAASLPMSNAMRVMVGPVSLPAIIDQSQLVVQSSSNRVQIFELHRWAGSLKNDVGRVIAANLARELNTSNVWNFSQSTQTQFDYQVLVDVQSVDSLLGEEVVLDVLWTIKPNTANTKSLAPMKSANNSPNAVPSLTAEMSRTAQVRAGRSLIREPVTGPGLDALVAAQSRAFAKVGDDIARAMR